MPVHLLDVRLTLVAEQELCRNVPEAVGVRTRRPLVLVFLDREVPQRDLVVGTGCCKARLIGRVPLDGGDGRSVPGEVYDGGRSWSRRADGTGRGVSKSSGRRTKDSKRAHPLKFRRSQTLMPPSSPPDASKYCVERFQLITLTSLLCAPATPIADLRSFMRMSQTRMLRSAEHDAKTVASCGDH